MLTLVTSFSPEENTIEAAVAFLRNPAQLKAAIQAIARPDDKMTAMNDFIGVAEGLRVHFEDAFEAALDDSVDEQGEYSQEAMDLMWPAYVWEEVSNVAFNLALYECKAVLGITSV